MKKASQRSVVEEMSTGDSAGEELSHPMPHQAPAALTAAPEEISPVESAVHDFPAANSQIAAAEMPDMDTVRPAVQVVPVQPPARALPEPARSGYAAEPDEPGEPPAAGKVNAKASAKPANKKTGFWQTEEQWARTRSTYDSTRRMTKHKTLSDYIDAAVELYNRHNEEMYNGGEPFDSDPWDIPKGRPLGS